jgi:hypothetical protein
MRRSCGSDSGTKDAGELNVLSTVSVTKITLERYLQDGRYEIARQVTRLLAYRKVVVLRHVHGEPIEGREMLWVPLKDNKDEVFVQEWLDEHG